MFRKLFSFPNPKPKNKEKKRNKIEEIHQQIFMTLKGPSTENNRLCKITQETKVKWLTYLVCREDINRIVYKDLIQWKHELHARNIKGHQRTVSQ